MRPNPVEFRARLAAALRELRAGGRSDPVVMAHLGTLAGRLAQRAGARDWAELKSALSPAAADSLLATFQTQGNRLATDRNGKSASAINLLALSLLGTVHTDAQSRAGVELLDAAIARAMTLYAGRAAAGAAPPPRSR